LLRSCELTKLAPGLEGQRVDDASDTVSADPNEATGVALAPSTTEAPGRRRDFLAATLLLVAFAFVIGLAVNAPVRRVGDGHEYVAMAQAIVQFRPPSYTAQELADFKQWLAAQPQDSVFRGAQMDHPKLVAAGRQDFPHFWLYSLFAAPFVAAATQLGVHPNYGFLALNSILLAIALWQVARATSPAVALVLLATPVVWYVNKAHTEVFTFSLLSIALARSLRGDYLGGALAAAVASAQNPPILGVAALLWGAAAGRWYVGRQSVRGPMSPPITARTARLVALTLLFGGIAPAYYWTRLGAVTPLTREGYSLHIPSLDEFNAVLLDPDIGLVAWAPTLVILGIVGCAALLRSRGNVDRRLSDIRFVSLVAAVSALVFMLSFPQIGQANHGASVFMSRYALWLIPLSLPLLASLAERGWERALLVTGCGTLVLYAFAFNPAQPETYLTASPQARVIYECLPCVFEPLSEVFTERRAGVDRERRSGIDIPSGMRGGSAADESCQRLLLERSSPITRCRVSTDEWRQANTLFAEGWRSVWIVRRGTLGLCPSAVTGNERASPADPPAPTVSRERDPQIEGLLARTTACAEVECRAFGGINVIRSVAGGVEIVGWAALPPGAPPPRSLLVVFGDEPVAATTRDQPRPDVAEALRRPDLALAGFRAIVPYERIAYLVVDGTACPTAIRTITADATKFADFPVQPTKCDLRAAPP
jgi:hypothetical protein